MIDFLKKFLSVLWTLSFLSAATVGLAQQRNITVKGSDTMVNLATKWAETYMKAHPGVNIQVTGGGSGVGLAAIVNGTTDIANSSRPITNKEKAAVKENGIMPVEFTVAMDALSVVVNKDNPVNELTMKQIAAIYVGAINNWKEVGGKDQPILRYSRESSSGTYVFFKEHVLENRDYAPDCQTMPGTAAVAEAVEKDKNGIGFGGVAYFLARPSCKILKVKKDAQAPAVSPVKADGSGVNFEVVYSGVYPIARYLYWYTAGQPKGEIKNYLAWILGPGGQKIVAEEGYIPLQTKSKSGSKK